MPYFILFSHYANSTRSTEGLGYFTPYCSWSEALIAQRAEASILRPSEQCLQPHNKSRECFSSGSQKPRLPARRDGVKDLLTPPSSFPWPEHRHFHLPPFPPQFTSVQRLAAYRPLFLPPPQQQVGAPCQFSCTNMPVSWVRLQGPLTLMCPEVIYAKRSANLGRRYTRCICLTASKARGAATFG